MARRRTGRRQGGGLEAFSSAVARWTGGSTAFGAALGVVAVWGLTGPLFNYSDTWQLVINTGTTIVTFLMVFLIQRSQNKDNLALQLKLNELIAAVNEASNRLIDVEDLDEADLDVLHRYYGELAALTKNDHGVAQSHSVEEARRRFDAKQARRLRSHARD
ncbi:MAG: low affinity iron permease family protein [Vicinamibacterales bacterium]